MKKEEILIAFLHQTKKKEENLQSCFLRQNPTKGHNYGGFSEILGKIVNTPFT